MKEDVSVGISTGSQRGLHGRLRLFAVFATLFVLAFFNFYHPVSRPDQIISSKRRYVQEQCKYINTPAGPPPNFHTRSQSDRFVPGTKPVLLRNAKLWTGARNGTEIVFGDVFFDKGIIKAVGYIPHSILSTVPNEELEVHDLDGAWVTPGLVDLHSHIGVHSLPLSQGTLDGNSYNAPILPMLRSIDGLNTHDASYSLAISGGVTTAQILPGSANNIGGQAFVIKLRATSERSTSSKVLEPPYTLNGTDFDHSLTPRWRHMKHACGENPSRVYSQTRMDTIWNFRQAYNEARKIKDAQDLFCNKIDNGLWNEVDENAFPQDLQSEALVDVLRGKVKLSIHCYEAVDLDGIIRLSNEFQFPVASFHHASEAYLVPDLLKKAWGGVPTIALFASNFRKKREAYRSSEFGPRILADHGIPVVMKSDHPVLNSRYLLHEAAQAHYYGLHPALALASVTSTPANAAGLAHRIGTIQEGYDADIVIWDSHPLALGATPSQVYIDGIPQLVTPYISAKPPSFQIPPTTPNFDREAADAVTYEGLPPLQSKTSKLVAFVNVKSVHTKSDVGIKTLLNGDEKQNGENVRWSVVVRDGNITCAGAELSCISDLLDDAEVVDLRGGSLAPGLTSFGSPLGLSEILHESSTNDGFVYDGLTAEVPSVLGGDHVVIRAVDGLQFAGRNTLLSYRSGVTTSVSAPNGYGFLQGLSTAFTTGSNHALEEGAILRDEVALHVTIKRPSSPGISTHIAVLRRFLFEDSNDLVVTSATRSAWERVKQGKITLVVHVENADVMATLLSLKAEYEGRTAQILRLTFAGAAEAHLLADEIGKAGVSVILAPSRPFPYIWDQRRILPGPPLSYESAVTALMASGVNVGIGVRDSSAARNTRFDIAWAALESNERIRGTQAMALASVNLDRALGLEFSAWDDLVVYQDGGMLDMGSKVVGVISPRRKVVDMF